MFDFTYHPIEGTNDEQIDKLRTTMRRLVDELDYELNRSGESGASGGWASKSYVDQSINAAVDETWRGYYGSGIIASDGDGGGGEAGT